ncbi:MAG: recombinase RecA [Candidatus Andersenbacteria bacterium]|nr:recombinase RecA [Candidatus Andersenbacteria bacterium]
MPSEPTKTKEKQSAQDDRDIAVGSAVDMIKEKFGEGAIMRLGEIKKVDIDAIPTGSVSLDIALGIGGVPRGRIVEIYGPESSGKSTLALHITANCQKKGGTVAYVDAEHALDPQYAKRVGVNLNDLLISQPDNGEQALDIVETLVKSGAVDLIVVDSVAALTPRAEIEGEMGDSHMGLQARLMSQALRKLTGIVAKTNTTVIFINQIRMKIGIVFGNPEETTGGKALKFYSSVRLEIRRRAQIKMGEKIIGSRAYVKIVKNKVAPPFRVAEFDIMYNEGISYEGDIIDKAIEYKLVQKAGSWLSMGDQKIGQGREAAKMFLRQNPKVAKDLEKAIWAAVEVEDKATLEGK